MKATIVVKGMRCNSCEILLKDALGELRGIKKAGISYKKERVVVEFDESQLNENQIKETIVKEGYRVG